jgi:hypothetical protein
MRTFKEFLCERERIDEAARRSLKRNLDKWATGINRPVAIITAFQGGSDPESRLVANRIANRSLVDDIKQAGLSFYPVKGAGQEIRKLLWKIPYVVASEEESFVVQPRSAEMAEEQFVAVIQQLLGKYNQYAAAVKLPSTPQAFLLQQDGTKQDIGAGAGPRTNQDAYYTQLRAGKRADDLMTSPWEREGEPNPIKRAVNWLRGDPRLNRPTDKKPGQRFTIKNPGPQAHIEGNV